MKIVLLGHHDVASLFALNQVMTHLPQHRYTVFMSGELESTTTTVPALAGLASADRALCRELLDTPGIAADLPDAPALPQPNRNAGLALLQRLAPDVIVSIRSRRILRDSAIAVPAHGVLNQHSGILPDYKGVMATFWAMLHREPHTGTTLHRIVDSGIDTGPVLGIERQKARYDESYLGNVLRLYSPGCDMIVKALRALDAGAEPGTYPQPAGGRYYSVPGAGDVARFEASGLQLVDGSERRTLAALLQRR